MLAVAVRPDHSLAMAEVPDPDAGPGEVVIDVVATAVNRADISQRRGNYAPPPGASEILGLEVAGTISELGEGVSGWKIGDRVVALLAGGGYAERVACPAGQLLPLGSLEFEEGAALVEALATAWLNLAHEGQLRRGEHVLIHAGASGVGSAAIQVARHLGALPWVTVGSRTKLDYCLELGAEGGLDRHPSNAEAFAELTKTWTNGGGIDLVLCPVGAAYLDLNLKALAVDGRLVIIGLMGGRSAELDLGRLLVKRQRIVGSLLRPRSVAEKSWLLGELGLRLWPRVLAREIRIPVNATFALAEVEAAHTLVESNATMGKVVLRVSGSGRPRAPVEGRPTS
jgi:putative PIG3 family NAD(P)H quinone oxidoreductase